MDEDLIEKKIAGESVFDGKLLHVRRDTVLLPNGHETIREWVKHPGASAVLPVMDDGSVILVRQYRYPVGRVTLETAMNYGKKICPTCCSTARPASCCIWRR